MGLLTRLKPGRGKTFVLALASLAIAVAVWSINGGRDRTVPPGTPFRHDDQSFNVRSARRLEGQGGPTTLTIRLEVRNEALRVSSTFRRDSALIVDDQGRFTRPNAGPLGPCGAELPAGASCAEVVTFEIPNDAEGLRLRIDVGGVDDTLERLTRGWIWVELEPGRPRKRTGG